MSRLFKRHIEVIVGDLRFNNTDLDIEFKVEFDDDLEPNLSEITIYNLSDSTKNRLKRGQKLTINAGYVEDKGVILNGNIEYVSTKKTGADRATIIKVLDSVPFNSTKTVQMSFKAGIKAEQIIRQIASKIGLKISVLKLPTNKVFDKGHSVDGEAIAEIQKIAVDCGASAYISRSQTYIRPITEGDNHSFKLNSDTGLIGSPEYFEKTKKGKTIKGYKIKSLLQHRMNTASIIELESAEVKVTLRVQKGKHTARGKTFYTEVEAIM